MIQQTQLSVDNKFSVRRVLVAKVVGAVEESVVDCLRPKYMLCVATLGVSRGRFNSS